MMSDRHFQGNGIRLRAPEPEDLEVMFCLRMLRMCGK